MVDCTKRQREIHDGAELHRCIHKESELFKEIVEDSQCNACPVRMMMKKKPVPCETTLNLNQLPVIESQDGYPQCPYRYESTVGMKCSMTNLPVDREICHRCDKDTRDHEAKLGDKVKNYYGAVRRWMANGRPTRSAEEIEQLFEDHCKGCERYDHVKHACKNCGCTVSTDSSPLTNKLAMKTEHCPLGRF